MWRWRGEGEWKMECEKVEEWYGREAGVKRDGGGG